MTKEEFNKKLDERFTFEQQVLINPMIYWNPDHIEYWVNYQVGEYEDCYDFLVENEHLITKN